MNATPDRRIVEQFLLSGIVTLPEAQELVTHSADSSVSRNIQDGLMLHLFSHPLGEAGPRSGLAELQAFGKAVERERQAWTNFQDGFGARILQEASMTASSTNRKQLRMQILTKLGSPSSSARESAINVATDVFCFRVEDSLMHPVLAIESIVDYVYISKDSDGLNQEISTFMNDALLLLEQWKNHRDERTMHLQSMTILIKERVMRSRKRLDALQQSGA